MAIGQDALNKGSPPCRRIAPLPTLERALPPTIEDQMLQDTCIQQQRVCLTPACGRLQPRAPAHAGMGDGDKEGVAFLIRPGKYNARHRTQYRQSTPPPFIYAHDRCEPAACGFAQVAMPL